MTTSERAEQTPAETKVVDLLAALEQSVLDARAARDHHRANRPVGTEPISPTGQPTSSCSRPCVDGWVQAYDQGGRPIERVSSPCPSCNPDPLHLRPLGPEGTVGR